MYRGPGCPHLVTSLFVTVGLQQSAALIQLQADSSHGVVCAVIGKILIGLESMSEQGAWLSSCSDPSGCNCWRPAERSSHSITA